MLQMLKHRPLGSSQDSLAQPPRWRTRQSPDEVRSLPTTRLIGVRNSPGHAEHSIRTDKRNRTAAKTAARHTSTIRARSSRRLHGHIQLLAGHLIVVTQRVM